MLFLFACKKDSDDPLTTDNASRITATTLFFQSCNACQNQIIYFRGIRPDDPNGREPISNPERGLRLEHIMHTSNLRNPYYGISYANNMEAEIRHDEHRYGEHTKLTQLYFYLTDYLKTKIPDQAFHNMQSVLDEVKKSGYKVILLFAYRYNDLCAYETYEDIKRHLTQLKPFLQRNEAVIYAFQAGFLGLWGEWHHSGLDNSPYHRKVVVRDILQTIPASRKMQLRETIYKTDAAGFIRRTPNGPIQFYPLNEEEYIRIGFQNAYFVLDQGPNSHWDYRWMEPDYIMVEKEALSTIVDGEMPYDGNGYGTFNILAYGNQGGWQATKRMKAHAYSSFSLVHNYRTNIQNWKKQSITARHFRNSNMAVTDDYFLNGQGFEVTRTPYEYIRDHLGYRFQLNEANMPSNIYRGDSARISIQLKNFGFAPLVNKRPVYLVLIDEQGQLKECLTAADPRQWLPVRSPFGPNYTIKHSFLVDHSFGPGRYRLGIWMPDNDSELRYNPAFAIRFANANIEWWNDAADRYLVNIIGSFQVN